MKIKRRFLTFARAQLVNGRTWITRAVVLAFAAAAGLAVVAFTWIGERALHAFTSLVAGHGWAVLVWTPMLTAAIVWITRRLAPSAAGSGIPQVMAAIEQGDAHASAASPLVSVRLAFAKIALTAAGLLGGLSIGREGPSVQVAAGVLHAARRWLPDPRMPTHRDLLVAGGAAGIAAAFNTPLGGIMFAIEELLRQPERRNSGLLLAAIVLAGLISVSIYGNATYFGVIRVPELGRELVGPTLVLAVACGLAGGLFSRLLIESLAGQGDRINRWRRLHPVRFALVCGLAVAVIGLVSGGSTFGSGYMATRGLLDGTGSAPVAYVFLKLLATWISAWSGVPGGIFAPSLAIGAGIGSDAALLFASPHAPALVALGMAGFLAGVTQAPLTAFIIVMEMVDGHAMVLSLMACAMVSNLVSRGVSPPLYATLARGQFAAPGSVAARA